MQDRIVDVRAPAEDVSDEPRRSARRRRTPIVFALLLGLVVVGPALSDLIQAMLVDWRPLGDNAIILRRALDVGTAHNPTVGMPSSFTVWTGEASYHPGPMVYWLFAPIARLTGTGGIWSLVVVALVRIAAGAAIVLIAAKLGGRRHAVAAGIALAIAIISAPALYEPLNPHVATMPFALLPFLCWAIICGRRRAVPIAALTGSFVVQAELGFAPMTLVLFAAVGIIGARRWRHEGRSFVRRNRRAAAWAAAIVAVCWASPAVEALRHGGGNLWAIVTASAQSDIPSAGLAGVLDGGAVLLVVGSIAAIVWWSRRDAATERAIAPIGAAVLVGYVATLWLQPTTDGVSGLYATFGPTVFLGFTVLCAAIELVHDRAFRWSPAATVATAIVLAICAITATDQPTSLPHRTSYLAAQGLAVDITDRLRKGSHEKVVIRNPGAFPVRDVGITVSAELGSQGIDAYVADGLVPYFGARRDAADQPGLPEVWIVDGRAPEPPVADAVLIATWTPTHDAHEVAALDRTLVDTVSAAGEITLTDRADIVVPFLLHGWPEVRAAYEDDPSSLRDAPGPVLESLYLTGLVTSPTLHWETALDLDQRRAGHRISAYLVA
ncbi:hypothetical protein ACE2AJ_03545 [Aquihabitans daechungensis]|uniref:hypothetical protein n=1 Tax=Aquihabitans daechungensis TaxID=1052257 RepID=UPI003B9EADF4